ncbi:MAG: asparagine synthase-related protein [Mucilaginibacter sp.]
MTVFSGIFTLSGEQHDDNLAAMVRSFDMRYGDNIATWQDDKIALAQATPDGNAQSLQKKFPFFHAEMKLVIAGDIRLDNRDELFARLAVPMGQRTGMGDAELVLLAYRKWHEQCASHLLGDFVFVVWNQEREELFCSIDHFGRRSFFYYFDGQRLIFSSQVQAIAAVPGVVTSPNYDRLARFVDLTVYGGRQEESWYSNIFKLLPATTLKASARGIKTRRYWEPALGKELRFKNDDEYREAFQEVFFKAVSYRLRSEFPVTALLSGGLDSSAIVSVAAKILEKQNKQLHVFSAVLPDENDPVLKDERYYIDLFKSFPNVRIHYAVPQEKGFFSNIEDRDRDMESPTLSSTGYLYHDFIQKATALNSRVILDGIFGELSVSNYGTGFYAELFRKFSWRLLWKEMRARKTLVGDSIALQLRSELIKPLLPDFLADIYRKTDKVDINSNGYNFFQPAFARELKDRARSLKDNSSIDLFHVGSNQRANQLSALTARHRKGSIQPDTGPVEFRYPLADKRLVEFCLNAPAGLKVRNGYKRSLVRIGLDGILPPEIQWRNTKIPFSPDYLRRYNAQLSRAVEFLNGIAMNDPVRRLIDVEKMKGYARIAVAENETDPFKKQMAAHHLPKAIYTIRFLRQFKEFQC